MPYNPADHPYPALRYGANAATRVVNSADEDAQAQDEGFRDHPSKVGKAVAKPPTPPITPAPTPAQVKTPKAAKAPAKPKAQKEPEAETPPPAAAPTPLETAISEAVAAQPAAFDRAVAIATLEAANFEVDPATTDEELVEALAELAR